MVILLGVWVGDVRGRGQGAAPSTRRGSSVDTCLGRVGRSRDRIERRTAAARTITMVMGIATVEPGWASQGIVRGTDTRRDGRAGWARPGAGQTKAKGTVRDKTIPQKVKFHL